MPKINYILLSLLALLMAACDEGRLYDDVVVTRQEGRVVKVTAEMCGIGAWAGGNQLVLAGFADSDYAEITKEITGDVTVLSGVPDNVTTVEICAINRLRKRMLTFKTLDISEVVDGDTIRWSAGKCGASMFDGIQKRVFDTTCANCHGGSNKAAAGLYLTADRSYNAIVGVESKVSEGDTIIVPGNASASLLYRMLTSDLTSSWIYDHSFEVVDPSVLDMISTWIDNNAQK